MSKSRKLKIIILAFAFSMAFVSTIVLAEQTNDSVVPGSSDDPLVTLSYVTDVLKPQIEADILAAISGVDASTIAGMLAGSSSEGNIVSSTPSYTGNTEETEQPQTNLSSASYEVVELKNGQKIRPSTGTLELIVRQGTMAIAISPHETQGIGNLTEGTEILNNEIIPINHSLLIPRADGRCVQIISDVAYIMVRGDYEIVE